MSTGCRSLLIGLLVVLAAAPAAGGATRSGPRIAQLGPSPATIAAGDSFRSRGRVSNLPRRITQSGRLTFTLAKRRNARSGLKLKSTSPRRTRGSRSRGFSVRIRIPAGTTPGAYWFRACVRKGSARSHCKARRMRVTPKPGGSTPGGGGPGGGAPGGGTPGGGTPGAGGLAARRSLRAALTSERFYFVMADRFANGSDANDTGGIPGTHQQHGYKPDGTGWYHGGDLEGLLGKLDYIENLGTTAIWLTPSFKNRAVQLEDNSAGYHGYWITDFEQIDPHLGTNQELQDLIDAAHARGMKVFFDIITNHTADVIDYEEAHRPGYVSKDVDPYRTAAGTVFDDRDFAGGGTFPPLDPDQSFPYTPKFNSAADETVKHPAWLNDVTNYHNRGNTTFVGENSQYGDFFGLDDLFTEKPEVVDGMVDIYAKWIEDFGIDGFRIDTMKHVNDEFWREFGPRVLDIAHAAGKSEFLMFGEVFDTTKTYTSHFTTQDGVQAVLDFPFQAAAQSFAASSSATDDLRDFFAGDDWYTDADSNAYQLPTFLGNHDMGRIGMFLRNANPGATDTEIVARDRLAHALMYFSRGQPVVYYGDEQGFVGDGGDQGARQDMFASQVASYNDDDLIGTDRTTATESYDESHQLYEAIAGLAAVTTAHPALRNGAFQHRYSRPGAGIYAFSRFDRASQREYVVALNNSEGAREALVPTSAGAGAAFARVYGGGPRTATTDAQGQVPVTLPPLSTVVFRSAAAIPASPAAPSISLAPLPGEARDRAEVQAVVGGDSFYDVTFHARVPGGDWTAIGTDDNRPFRVFHDVSGIAPGTPVEYRAVVIDNAEHTRMSEVAERRVAEPTIAMTAPPDGGHIRDEVRLSAEAMPDHNDHSVEFFRKIGDGEWTSVDTDDSQPAYSAVDVLPPGLDDGTQVHYRAVLTYATGLTVTSATRTTTVTAPVTTAVVHYNRPSADYADWGLHLWGTGKAGPDTAWDTPKQRDGTDAYGAYFNIAIADDRQPVNFIVHRSGANANTTEPGGDRSFIPIDHDEIWLKQGDPTIYFAPPP
jgi:alpha-amylase